MKYFLLSLFFVIGLLSLPTSGQGQDILDTIFLRNPSFEHDDFGRVAGWTDCGFPTKTAFDAQPLPPSRNFGCRAVASNGEGYIGLVVRDDETYEALGQRMYKPLTRGKCYAFSLKLAQSDFYLSQSPTTKLPMQYTTPARIRIWGGQSPCQKMEMLDETGIIANHSWKAYYFKLKPLRDYQFLIIESFYKTPTLFPYNGNVLVDDATNIYEIKCDDEVEQVIAAVQSAKQQTAMAVKPKNKKDKPKVLPKPEKKVFVAPKPSVKSHMPGLNKRMKRGQTLTIPKLAFEANSYEIPKACQAVLGDLFAFMIEKPSVKIELGGHTNNRCDTEYCNKLSELRAKAIADYLIAKGISSLRVSYKGYGKTSPKETNSTKAGRLKNQRVEVKILES